MALSAAGRKKKSPTFRPGSQLIRQSARAARRTRFIAAWLTFSAARFGFRRPAIIATRLLGTACSALSLTLTLASAATTAATLLLATVLNRLRFN